MKTKLSLQEFMAASPAMLAAFADAYRREAQTDGTFVDSRTDDDWWREVAAYSRFVELGDSHPDLVRGSRGDQGRSS